MAGSSMFVAHLTDAASRIPALRTNATSPHFQYPYSLPALTSQIHWGLLGPGIAGLSSLLSCLANQYVILLINILVADIIQSSSYVISFYWIHRDSILAPTPACTAQGWLLNTGDLTSGFFVLFIALHTLYKTVFNGRLEQPIFYLLIGFTWLLSILLSSLGPALFSNTYYVRAGILCWVSNLYQTERLMLHYLWIFIVQFGSMFTYLAVFIHIRTTINRTESVSHFAPSNTRSKIDRAAKTMIVYPAVYIILSLPISTGRMWSMAHNGANLPIPFLLAAATLYASSGAANALLYTLTRRQLVGSGSTSAASRYADGSGASRPGMSRGMSFPSLRKPSLAKTPMSQRADPMEELKLDLVVHRDPYALDTIRGNNVDGNKAGWTAV
ncbi:hypothetical protein ANO11243_092510 [Dothideomycetidae sp. 11243]|nr:hypothetical protein ANO11243_092510 [fungal sp. No.11243]